MKYDLLYTNSGIVYENHCGTIIFHGTCSIGNNSAISVGANAAVEFGACFSATTILRLTSYDSVTFGDRISLGWDILNEVVVKATGVWWNIEDDKIEYLE